MTDITSCICPVCKQPFTEKDDVVVCPLCGAPHHRVCWKHTGHCALKDAHGTPGQWMPPLRRDDEDSMVCGNCGTVNRRGDVVCAKCGHTLDEPLPPAPSEQQPPIDASVFYADFSPYIGIAPDSMVEGFPAMEVATFLGPNSGYYLSRFYFMRVQKNNFTWNWAAAVFPAGWLLYRKMYKAFLVILLLSLILMAPVFALFWQFMSVLSSDEQARQLFLRSGLMPSADVPVWLVICANLSGTVSFILRAVMASLGNYLYRKHMVRVIGGVRAASADPIGIRYTLSRKGGTNIKAVVLLAVVSALIAAGVTAAACGCIPL